MQPSSHISLSRSALLENLTFIRGILGKSKLSAVVKGNAYGHGLNEYGTLLLECGVRHFSVFSADEAFELRKVLLAETEIMIMGYLDSAQVEWAVASGTSFFVFDMGRMEEALTAAKNQGRKAKIHIELETGMNRTGFHDYTWMALRECLERNSDFLEILGVCSHLAGAESAENHGRVSAQIQKFQNFRIQFSELAIFRKTGYHLACSAASMRYPDTQLDMARVGILQYGFFPSEEMEEEYNAAFPQSPNPLRRVLSWTSRVLDVRTVAAGEYVGYGSTYRAENELNIAIIPVGYAHGFSRNLSNSGRMIIRGRICPVIGIVNMNMTIIDVSACAAVQRGDEVVIIGRQGQTELSVASFSNYSAQVNYELLTRLPGNITRTIID